MINTLKTLDEVIFELHQINEPLTPEVLGKLTSQYPQYAGDIRAHAVEIIDMELLASFAESEDSVQRAVNAEIPVSLRSALREKGTSLRDFADTIDISRSIISDINSGRIDVTTIPEHFLHTSSALLNSAADWFKSVVCHSREMSPSSAFKAKTTPGSGRQRTWEEAVLNSDMDENRKLYWLSKGE